MNRKSIKDRVNKEFDRLTDEVVIRLNRVDHFSIIVDYWSAHSNSFLGVLVQFLDEKWKVQTLMIGF